jgi:hypothetical protein
MTDEQSKRTAGRAAILAEYMLIFLFSIRSRSSQRNYIWLLVVNFIISYQSSAAPEVQLIPAQQ